MALRLHRHGRFRRWLGESLGGDEVLGDRVWRRIMHTCGAAVLVYYAVPVDFFVIAPKEDILLAALAAILVLEVLRHAVDLELPTLRPYERRRVASFVFFAIALVAAVLLFPVPIGAAIVLGTALVDPIAGELRHETASPLLWLGLPLVAYALLAFVGMVAIGGWPAGPSALLAVAAAPLAIVAEWPKYPWVDDDLVMTVVPGVFLYAVGVLALGLPA
jgi:hypothetical protein